MANEFNRFLELLPRNVTTVVSITAINAAAGTSTATTLGGVTVTVQGTSVAVGRRAYVTNNVIDREAPNFNIVTVRV